MLCSLWGCSPPHLCALSAQVPVFWSSQGWPPCATSKATHCRGCSRGNFSPPAPLLILVAALSMWPRKPMGSPCIGGCCWEGGHTFLAWLWALNPFVRWRIRADEYGLLMKSLYSRSRCSLSMRSQRWQSSAHEVPGISSLLPSHTAVLCPAPHCHRLLGCAAGQGFAARYGPVQRCPGLIPVCGGGCRARPQPFLAVFQVGWDVFLFSLQCIGFGLPESSSQGCSTQCAGGAGCPHGLARPGWPCSPSSS